MCVYVNISVAHAYGVCISQLIAYSWTCTKFELWCPAMVSSFSSICDTCRVTIDSVAASLPVVTLYQIYHIFPPFMPLVLIDVKQLSTILMHFSDLILLFGQLIILLLLCACFKYCWTFENRTHAGLFEDFCLTAWLRIKTRGINGGNDWR
jgi:hypothetical protein